MLKKMMAPAQLMVRIFYLTATFIFLLFPLASRASNNIATLSWQENTNLTSSGKISEILAQGHIKNLPANQVMTSLSIGFDLRRNLKITDVICDGKSAEFSFNKNVLQIKFAKHKASDDAFSIYFAYEEKYEKVDKFLREEIIEIPNFAAGADSKVVINFPGYLESATLNPNVTKVGNSFVYSNKVSVEGARELIKLTPSQSTWDLAVKTKISASQGLNNATATLPNYFQNGGQKVEGFSVTSNINPVAQDEKSGNRTLKFNTPSKAVIITAKARISTGKNNRPQIKRDPADYLEVSANESALLLPILDRIQRNPKYQNLPLYAKIGKYVHDLIRYDLNYAYKLPSIAEILRNPVGVCSEYSSLFNALARTAKIPSIDVAGAACDNLGQCKGHAWNIIYYDGKWIDVDPTWDLMSGIVSSSHVYFTERNKSSVSIKYFNSKESVGLTTDFEMKLVAQ